MLGHRKESKLSGALGSSSSCAVPKLLPERNHLVQDLQDLLHVLLKLIDLSWMTKWLWERMRDGLIEKLSSSFFTQTQPV